MRTHEDSLNPGKALIFRIVHVDNIPWILANGLHCGNSNAMAPNWVHIGNADLISRRADHRVKAPFEGTLHDYVPFYFTPFSPMLLNIKSGRNGVTQRPNDDIVILVGSLHRIASSGHRFLFTDAHAYVAYSNFYNDVQHLSRIDWRILQTRDFARDQNDPSKMERYQAEALIHQHLPVTALEGIVCYTEQVRARVQNEVQRNGLQLTVLSKSGWYF